MDIRKVRKNIIRNNVHVNVFPQRQKSTSIYEKFMPDEGTEFDNVTMLIACHKPCHIPVTNNCYKIIYDGKEPFNDTNLQVITDIGDGKYSKLNRSLCEVAKYSYAAEKLELKDYVGLCHYRRYFGFMNRIPDMDRLFEEYDAVSHFGAVGRGILTDDFKACHDVYNLFECFYSVPQLFPEYTTNEISDCLSKKMISDCNMLILKKKDFLKWLDFTGKIVDLFNQNHNIITDSDTTEYVKSTINRFTMKNVDYQSRLHGFITERLNNLFLAHNFQHILTDNFNY